MAYVQFFSVRPVHGFSDAQDPDAAPSTALLVLENDTHNIVAKTFINHENLCKLIQTL